MKRIRLTRVTLAIAPLLLLSTCTASEDCAAGNPLMPICFDPSPPEPQVVLLKAWDSTWVRADIYTMNADGTNSRRITTDGLRTLKMTAANPVWSPDGQSIAFARRADDSNLRAQINVVAADGSGMRNISNQTTAFDWSPTWSPDGRRIAFQSDRHNPATTTCCVTSIYVMNADGTNVVRLTADGNDKLPRWSPDGSTIAFNSTRSGGINQIFVMNADGSNIHQLTTDGTNRKPVWSPDGARIAFEGTRDATAGGMGSGIYTMNADGSGQMLVGQGLAMFMSPAWSIDGGQLLFCGSREATGKMRVFEVGMSGGDTRQVSDDGAESCCPDTKRPRRPGGPAMSR